MFQLFYLSSVLLSMTAYDTDDIQGRVTISNMFPSSNTVKFGEAFNTITLNKTNNIAVSVDVPTKQRTKAGFLVHTYKINLYKSREELYNELTGGVTATASYVGNEKIGFTKFISEMNMRCLDSVLVASIDVVCDTERVYNVKLKKAGVKLLNDGHVKDFVKLYGTHYLRKVIFGGKLLLLIKFSSKSLLNKAKLDTQLAHSTGTFGDEINFSKKIKNLSKNSKDFKIMLYAQGGAPIPTEVTLENAVTYVLSFSNDVLKNNAVREVQYAAVWTIPNSSIRALQSYIFPLQKHVDDVVHILVKLGEIQAEVEDYKALKTADLHFISSNGWTGLDKIRSEAELLIVNLQINFQSTPSEKLPRVIRTFTGKSEKLHGRISDIITEEKRYTPYKTMYLKSCAGEVYIGTEDGGYPMIIKSGIPLYMQGVEAGLTNNPLKYGITYVYLKSNVMKGQLLCMGTYSWYVYWKSAEDAYLPYCQWRLAHATNHVKRYLEYGDSIILYNGYWSNVIAGEYKGWLGAVDSAKSVEGKNRWVVEKSSP